MASAIYVGGKKQTRPGVYSQVVSGITNPPVALSSGNLCIVDDGTYGAGWMSYSGVLGTQSSGASSVYSFSNLKDFRAFANGGLLYNVAPLLFTPFAGVNGVSTVYYVRAATTTPSTYALTLTATHGSFTFTTVDEGTGSVGLVDTASSVLYQGYGFKIVQGSTSTKFAFKFYRGTYRGFDSANSVDIDYLAKGQTTAALVHQTPDFGTYREAVKYFLNNATFKQYFSLTAFDTATTVSTMLAKLDAFQSGSAGPLIGEIAFVSGDISSTYDLFTGGTETFDGTSYTAAMAAILNIDCSYFLAPNYGANALSSKNTTLQTTIAAFSNYDRFIVVPAGTLSTDLKGSSAPASDFIATTYNSDKVTVVHGGIKLSRLGGGFLLYDVFWKACHYLGTTLGLEPQVPSTFKKLNIAGEQHPLTTDDQEYCLSKGIAYSYYDTELKSFVWGQDVNSLQLNDYLINSDSSSYSVSVKRIASQLNKEIVVNAKVRFFGSNTSGNRNTITITDIQSWLEGFLRSKTATSNQDNLIITFRNINISVSGDAYYVTYNFVPNFEVNKLVFTGVILQA